MKTLRSLLASWGSAFLVLLLAAALRLYRLIGQSLWADEGNSAALALRDLATIAGDAAADIHPPLYYWALHVWVRLFGQGEAALRGLSVLAGVVAVGAVWAWARGVRGEGFAALAGLLAACSPFAVAYSQEVRMYVLLAGIANLGYLTLTTYVRQERADGKFPWGTAVGYALCCTAGLYTHYVFPVVWAIYNLGYLPTLADGPGRPLWRARLFRWVLLQVAVLLAYLPWLPVALQRLAAWPSVRAPLPPQAALQQAWEWLVVGPCPSPGPLAVLLLALVLAVVGGWALFRHSCAAQNLGVGGALLPALGTFLPILVVVTLGLSKPAYFKFLLVADGPLALLLAWGLWPRPGAAGLDDASCFRRTFRPVGLLRAGWFVLGLAMVLVGRGEGLHDYYFAQACARDDYRGIATYIAAIAQPGDAILLNAPGQGDVFRYYDQSGLPIYPLPRQRPPDPVQTEQELGEMAAQHSRLFALFWATGESDPDRVVETWLDEHAYKAMDVWRGNVRFVTYAVPQEGASLESTPLDVRFGRAIRLRGYAMLTNQVAPGDILQVTLLWEAMAAPSRRYKVTVQLLDEDSQVLAQRDAEPVGDTRPTDGWAPGERIEDHYGLFIPFGTPPGQGRLLVALYQPEDGQRLPVENRQGVSNHHLILPGEVQVVRPKVPPPLAALPAMVGKPLDLGEIRWLGCRVYPRGWSHQPDRPFFSGDEVHLDCYWQCSQPPTRQWTLRAALADRSGQVVMQWEGDLASARYPATDWQEGEVVRGQHDLSLAGVPAGGYQLTLWALPGTDLAGVQILGQSVRVQGPP
ncbi:MAG: glycosyltransferase family 39 protein [Anaerolineae bacterium]